MFSFQCFWQTHQPLGLLSFLGMMLNPPGPRLLRICGSDASSKSLLRAEFSSQKEMVGCCCPLHIGQRFSSSKTKANIKNTTTPGNMTPGKGSGGTSH